MLKPEILEIYIDIVTMLEGRIEDYSLLAKRIKYNFKVDITTEEIERFYSPEVQDMLIQSKNTGVNY